jgi:hypothetical protein
MTYPHSHRNDATGHEPPRAEADLDTCLIDDEYDDFLDRFLADFRESLADFRSL